MSNNLSANHFRSILEDETRKLNSLCKIWEEKLEKADPDSTNEENIGHIRSAIGLAHLLVNQRFKQFSGLIKNCEDNVTPKVTPMDLQGFWEMIYFQVEDIYSKFQYLEGLNF